MLQGIFPAETSAKKMSDDDFFVLLLSTNEPSFNRRGFSTSRNLDGTHRFAEVFRMGRQDKVRKRCRCNIKLLRKILGNLVDADGDVEGEVIRITFR